MLNKPFIKSREKFLFAFVENYFEIHKKEIKNDIINAGDSIRTGALSCADLLMGNLGIIRVQENSLVKIDTLVDPATGDTKFAMNNGKIYSTLGKLSKGSFQVKTPTSVASIRGTSFRISAGAYDSRLDVLDGNVHVNPVQNDAVVTSVETMVGSNQTIRLDRDTVIQAIQKKRQLKPLALRQDEIRRIKDEIRSIRPELIEKLRRGARKEFNSKIFDTIKKKKEELKKSKAG
ncbi:MAG: FecR family protein, partial [Planctomycetes bacterium]|nr:FecR family protein [Planctomycetota bacterium]